MARLYSLCCTIVETLINTCMDLIFRSLLSLCVPENILVPFSDHGRVIVTLQPLSFILSSLLKREIAFLPSDLWIQFFALLIMGLPLALDRINETFRVVLNQKKPVYVLISFFLSFLVLLNGQCQCLPWMFIALCLLYILVWIFKINVCGRYEWRKRKFHFSPRFTVSGLKLLTYLVDFRVHITDCICEELWNNCLLTHKCAILMKCVCINLSESRGAH